MEVPWDRVYAGDVPPDFDEMRKREDRKERIKPFWDLLVTDKEPKVNKENLVRLMHDLKEEGNALFKEDHYDIAWMHYRNAIFVVKILENRFYHTVEKEFTSSLFSNRAFCCLKKSMYKEAVQDCETAIGLYSKNIKAYYRQAQAYKHLNKYQDAYMSACNGQQVQPSSALKELIEELEPFVKGGNKTGNATRSAEVSAKADIQLVSSADPMPDDDWLTGTNVTVTEKHLETKSKMPSKKTKKKNRSPTAASSKTMVDNAKHEEEEEEEEDEEDTDEMSNHGVEDDHEFANMYRGVQRNTAVGSSLLDWPGSTGIRGLDIVAPKDTDEDTAWSFPHDVDEDSTNTSMKDGAQGVGMGLDTFTMTTDYQHSGSAESPSLTTSNPSSGRSSRASQSPSKFVTVTSKQSSATSSPALEPLPPIHFPLIEEYEFRLACRNCFRKNGQGIKGYVYDNAVHSCLRETLIVKKKRGQGMHWVKIRCRIESKGHYGPFKICTQFNKGNPCKVPEDKCTFPHHKAELELWTMDREGKFSVADFITKCNNYKIVSSEQLENQKAKQPQYIPGLNYAGDQGKKPLLVTPNIPPSVSHMAQGRPEAAGPVSRPSVVPVSKQQTTVQQTRYQSPVMYPTSSVTTGQAPPQAPTVVSAFGYSQNSIPQSSTGYVQFNYPPPKLPSQSQSQMTAQPVFQRQDQALHSENVAKLENPLSETHDTLIVCQHCFKATSQADLYEFKPLTHKCEETILAMRPKNGSFFWFRVRERKNHREFPGNYILCRSITFKNPIYCKYGIELCSFAHNDAERYFWTLEKDGKFNITEFLIQNRKFSAGKGFSLKEILDKHGGYFEFVCKECYYGQPARITFEKANNSCGADANHTWKECKILAHIGPKGYTLINQRGFLHKTAFFKICRWLQFCKNKKTAACRFSHSFVERDIWMLERDSGLSRDAIVKDSKALRNVQTHALGDKETIPAANVVLGTNTSSSRTLETLPTGAELIEDRLVDGLCPFVVLEICETCWKNGQKTQQVPGKDRCQKNHANWSRNIIYLLSPSNKELRPLPKKIPKHNNFIVCRNVQEGRKCVYPGPGPCQFAHSNEELEAWKYMCINKLETQTQLSDVSRAAQKKRAEEQKSKISGQQVVSVSVGGVTPQRLSFPVSNDYTFYCHYCGISCNSQKQWDEHCASEKHNFNMNSDKEHQWNFRQPPWASSKSYSLCAKHLNSQSCNFSKVPEMYNLCLNAHSQEELDEWRERYEWRQMKREMARQDKVFSYMDQLLEKYESSDNPVNVICENLEGVSVKTAGDLSIYREDKYATYIWTFEVKSKRNLEKIALLYNRDRLHFSLVIGSEKSSQIAQGEALATSFDHQGLLYYIVKLKFTGGMFGSFQQWVLFDFGSEPVLCRKISVEVGNQSAHEKVRHLREQLNFDRWTSQSRQIVRHEGSSPLESELVTKYKEPSSSSSVVTQTTVATELNRHNYVQKMHKLLELEEMTRHQIISSYNLCTAIECTDVIKETTFVFAKQGELFAKVPLQEDLTEDTDAGKLILTSVRNVFLAPETDKDTVIFEASIVREENFNYDGRGRDFIYLCLSPQCVRRLGLKSGISFNVEIQFQMDRLFFCRMHYAVDQLESTNIVFPDVPKINPLRNERRNLKLGSSVLNQDQMAAVRHIVAERTGYTPPFVLFGPFGTGKTETIAQATMVLLRESRQSKILICAQSNSAADLYITKHLDSFLKKQNLTSTLRRVYFKERRVYTVAAEIKKYCLLSPDGDSFEMPSKEDIEKHRVVIVTVTTSLFLTSLKLRGYFTHIFIDEAAQTLECEALMPVSLATEKTCIVLAGDHKQISPKVYSEEARNQNFHQSLLERLFNYYDSYSMYSSMITKESPLNILLSINYRTKMEILRFISAVFYGGPDVLRSEANIKSVIGITPLVFYAVQGKETQDESKISYYNVSEVQEVVERVDDLYDKWPEEWGPKSAKEIGVVTPYYDQVQLLRKALKKRNFNLRDVMVERVQGVQGKEFRAMFITTVRTRHLIEAPHVQSKALTECDGDGGDFGFLSDPKLLNTALTRAQSLVVVVGDPVALCAIGECVNVWRTYLKHCQNMSSLFPQNHNFDSIRQQVQNLLNSPARERLLEIANQIQSTKNQMYKKGAADKPKEVSGGPEEIDGGMSAVARHAENFPGLQGGEETLGAINVNVPPPTHPNIGLSFKNGGLSIPVMNGVGGSVRSPLTPLTSLGGFNPRKATSSLPLNQIQQRKQESYYELGEEFIIDPDDVIQQLAKLNCAENGSGTPLTTGMNKIPAQIKEESGHAVVYSQSEKVVTNAEAPVNYDGNHLQKLLSSEPARYLHCKLHIDEKGSYGEVMDEESSVKRIEILSRWLCGRGLDRDEVVVEVLRNGSKTGQVVGVLKRARDLKTKYIVCRADGGGGVMVPLDKGLSPMVSLTTAAFMASNSAGKVSVYRFTKSKQVRFSHLESVSSVDMCDKVFVVRYLKWNSKLRLPMCIIVGVLPAGSDVPTGMRLLDLEHQVNKSYEPVASQEAERLQLTDAMINSRNVDLRSNWCFIIESPVVEDVSRAFSIEENGDGTYTVGVHVTDVASFVPKDSAIDLECANRGTSLYPASSEPVPMLPAKLCKSVCSLQKNQDRLAFSVLMMVQPTGELAQIHVQKTLINCKQRYTYQEAEEVLHDPNACQDYVKSCILVLFQISRLWRRARLGNAALYHEELCEKLTPLSHQLVNEIVLMTEHHVARIIYERNPLVAPLYVQPPPDESVLVTWRQNHAADAINSIALTKPFLNTAELETCSCGLACTHTVNFVKQNNMQKRDYIEVDSVLWDSLNDAIAIGDIHYIQNIIVAAENHPQLAVALINLQLIQNASQFVCSADASEEKQLNYSLNKRPYITFTQPMSRYADVVVQRLLLACLDSLPCPYTQVEVQDICNHLNTIVAMGNEYDDNVLTLHLCYALLSRPMAAHPVVKQLSQESVELGFPLLTAIPAKQCKVLLEDLGVCEVPVTTHTGQVLLRWQERIYDFGVCLNNQAFGSNEGELNPDRFIYKIPAFQWQRLLSAVREKDDQVRDQKLHSVLESVRKQVVNPALSGNYIDDVTSEVHKMGNIKHFTDAIMQLHQCQVLQVQLSAKVDDGLLTPYVQLVSLAPLFTICLEHRHNPVRCFTRDSSHVLPITDMASFTDISSYKKLWTPIVELEAAERAVAGGERITIHNVKLQWREKTDIKVFTAHFSLPVSFLIKRKIKVDSEAQLRNLFSASNSVYCKSFFSDFVCVRYSNVDLPVEPGLSEAVSVMVNNGAPATWIGHCSVVDVALSNDHVVFKLELLQSDVSLPLILVQSLPCTLEIIPRTQLDRNIINSLNCLDSASSLCKEILLRKVNGSKVAFVDVEAQKKVCRSLYHSPNQQQDEALSCALRQPLTVIQGAVGSGKSELVTRLAFMFSQHNRSSRGDQVLVCAQTEASLNVLSNYLLSLESACPKIVRLQSHDVESVVHPLPNHVIRPTLQHADIYTESLRSMFSSVSLYEQVRHADSPYSQRLKEFETLFSLYPDDISEDQLREYLDLLCKAETLVLHESEIILCTCGTSASSKLVHLNVKQIIIDDANQCTEPELMVALSAHNSVQQVVLVGDSGQLTPQVTSPVAAQLGLAKSLLSSYVDKAINLTIQYRMHEDIVEFPNQFNYGGNLLTGSPVQRQPSILNWPGGRSRPSAFCILPGSETKEQLPVVYPCSQAIANSTQAEFTVKVAAALVSRYQVAESNVAVISMTKGQAVMVGKLLRADITSLSVTEAQGLEFDYVILSTVRTVPQQKLELQPNSTWQSANLGSLMDHNLVSVALTRARKGLVIVGNADLLRLDAMWSKLLSDYEQKKKLVSAEAFLKSMSM